MKQRILYIWKGQYPWEIRVKKFCQAFIDSGYDVLVLCRNNDKIDSRATVEGINVVRISNNTNLMSLPVPGNPIWLKAIKKAIVEFQPTIIIVREIMLAQVAAALGKHHHIPVIIDMAEFYPEAMRIWKNYNSNFISRFMMHKLRIPDIVEQRAVSLCSGIIVVCDEQVERLHQQYCYNKQNICIVNNTPILNDMEAASRTIIDLRYKIANNLPITFCHHGYLSMTNLLTNSLLGFEMIADKYNIQYIVAGTGECLDDYKRIVENFKHKDKIIFWGEYDYSSLPIILNKIDIGIIPYHTNNFINHTLTNKSFDYLLTGKPILSSDVKPMRRFLEETKAGLVLDFNTPESAANAIETMLLSDTVTMSRNAITAANNKYNWTVDANTLISFITKMSTLYKQPQ